MLQKRGIFYREIGGFFMEILSVTSGIFSPVKLHFDVLTQNIIFC